MSGTWIWLPPAEGGGSLYFGDPVVDVTDLPLTGLSGEVRYVINENAFYVWGGAAWVPVSIAAVIDINTGTTGTLNANRVQYLTTVTSDVQTQLNGKLSLTGGTMTGAITLANVTTVQRDALTPATGMLVFNTDTSRFQGYFSGAWSDIHGWGS